MDLFAPDPERKDYNFPDDIPDALKPTPKVTATVADSFKPTKKAPEDAYSAYLSSQDETTRVRRAITNVGALASPQDAAKAFNLQQETGVDPLQALDPEVRKLYEKTAALSKIPIERLLGSRTAQWAAKDPLNTDLVGGDYQHLLSTEDAADGIPADATPGMRKAILEDRARSSSHNAKTSAFESLLAGNAEALANFTTKPLLSGLNLLVRKSDEALSKVFGIQPGVPGDPLGTGANFFNAGEQQIKTGVSPVLVDKETGRTFDNPDIKAFGSTFLGKEVFNQQALNSVAAIPGTLLGMAVATATGGAAGLNTAAAHGVVPFYLGAETGLNTMDRARQSRLDQGKPADPTMDLVEGTITGAVTTLLFSMPGGAPAKTTLGAFGTGLGRAAVLGPALAASENAAAYLHGEDRPLWEGAVRGFSSFLPWEMIGPLQRMSGLAVDSSLRKLSEHKYIEATNHITEGTPFESAAIKAQDLVKYFQSKNIGEDATHRFVESLGVTSEQFRVALATGGDINVKMGDYLAKVAASEHREGIEPLVKIGGVNQTVGEIHDHIAVTRELASVTAALKNIPATDPQRDLLRDKIAEEFGAATKVFTPSQVLEVADAFAKVITVQAPKVQKTPEQLFEQSKLTVMNGMQDALAKRAEPTTTLEQPVRGQLREARQQILKLKDVNFLGYKNALVEQHGENFNKVRSATSFMGEKGEKALKLIFEKASQKEMAGAPPTVRNAEDHAALVDRLTQMAKAGESGRFWYDDSAKAFLKLANGNELEAYKLAVLSAIYSPQTSVADNGRRAILAYYDAMQNRAISPGGVYPKVKELAQRIVDAKTTAELDNLISTQKVDAFQQNLINLFAPEHLKSDVATIDLHMMRALGYDKEAVSAPQYKYASDVMREVADQLGWDTAKEAQAAIWVAQKMGTDAKGKGSTADQAGVHYGTAADKIAGTVNVEGMPGASERNAIFPNIQNATHQQLVQYHTDKMQIVHDTLRAAGIMVSSEATGHGYWEGESNPVTAFRIPLPHIGSAAEHQLAPAARAEIERAARLVLDLVGDQDAIGWAKPFEATTLGEANTAHYALSRELTHEEMLKLGQDFVQAGLPAFIDASDAKNIKVVNYDWSSVVSGAATQKSGQAKAYHKNLDAIIVKALPADMKVEVSRIFTESGLIERGSTNGNAEGSRVDAQGSSVSEAGHLARGRAEIAALNDRYRTEAGWGDGAGGTGLRGIPEFGPREAPAGALDAHGVHYNSQPNLTELRGDQRNGTRSQETGRLSGIDPQDAELGPLLLRKQFYISKDGELPVKERLVVGEHPHESMLKGLLDINSPAADRFKENAKILADASAGPGAYIENQFEKLVMDAGYNGTISGRVVTLLGHEAIPTRPFTGTVDVTGPTGGVVRLNQNPAPEFKAVDVETTQFKNWFGDSKAVDETGKPQVFYHGTFDEFTGFSDRKGRGIFFSTDPDFANYYGQGKEGRVIPTYLKTEKPFDYRNEADMKDYFDHLGLDGERLKYWQGDPEAEKYVGASRGEWDFMESTEFQKFLHDKGYDAYYVVENGSRNIAVFDPEQIKSATSNTGEFDPNSKNIMFQPDTGKNDPRGYLEFPAKADGTPREFKLALLANENKSTVFHELGHFYLELLGDMQMDPAADPSVREDYNKILNWLGVNDRSEITQAMHEKFADAHLQYLLEGKAPTPELVTPFKKFSKWLSKIGQQLLGVDVNMTDEVRGVFDRLYASDKEIEAANLQVKGDMFVTPEQAGMTPEKFDAYKKAAAAELDAAKERLTSVLMRELDREQKRDYKDQYERTWTMTNDEVLQRPEYEALKALSDGVMADGVTKVKLSRQALVERYGEDLPGKLTRDGNFVYTTEGGMDADSAAMMLGFSSGDKLIEALTGLEPRKALVDRMAKQRMEETHPSLMGNPEALREEAIKQLNGNQRERVLTLELQALRKKESQLRPVVEQALSEQSAEAKAAAKDREVLSQEQQRISADKAMEDRSAAREAAVMPKIQAFRLAASAYISQQSPYVIRPDQFLNTQRSSSREAFEKALKNDYEGAAKAKEQELLNHFLYLEAVHAKEEGEAFRDFVKRNDSGTVRGNLGKAGGTYLAQFDMLRDRFGIERETNSRIANRETLTQWVESMTKDAKDPVIADWLLDEMNTKNYRQLTMTEIRDLKNAMTNIKHLAYRELGEVIEGKRVEYADMMEELESNFGKNTTTRRPLISASDRKRDAISFKTTAALEGFDSTMVKMEAMMNWIDGDNVNGPAHRYMWERLVKAQEHESRLNVELNALLTKALEDMPKKQRTALHTETHDIGMDTEKTRGEILTMLLYSGHEVRRQKLLEGYASRGLTPEKLEKAFTKLQPADFELAKTVWATFDKLAPEIRAMEERLTGVLPEWEKPREFEVKGADGKTVVLPGGYFPLVADPALTGELGKKQEGGTVQQVLTGNGYSRAATSTGHTKGLTGKTYPLLLDFQRTLTSELANQIHDLTHREAILSINKILHNDRFQELAKTHIGEAYEKQFNPWLVNIASDRNAGSTAGVSAVNRLIEASRGNTVAAVLGFKYSSVVVQFADMLRVMAPGEYRVGPAAMSGAFMELNPFNPKRKEIVSMIRELSPEMAHREDHIDRDLRSRLQDLSGRSDVAAKWNRAAFGGLAAMDSLVSWPTWLGSYRQSMAKGTDSPTAAKEADRSVRMLLMAGAPKDLVPIQADKGQLYKLITMFMGDATSNYNSMRNAGHNINGLKGIPTLTGAVLFVMLNAVIGDLLKGQGPDDTESAGQWAARKALLAPMGTAWGLRDVASTWDNILADKPFHDYKFTAGLGAVQKALVDPVLHTKRLYDGTEEVSDYMLNVAESGGYLFGVGGTAQAAASAKYFKRYQEGTEQPANPAQFVYDFTRGKKKEKP